MPAEMQFTPTDEDLELPAEVEPARQLVVAINATQDAGYNLAEAQRYKAEHEQRVVDWTAKLADCEKAWAVAVDRLRAVLVAYERQP